MIEKILNKYFAKKLQERLESNLIVYFIDKKFIYKNKTLELYIKNTKWKDEEFILVAAIPFEECFDLLTCRNANYSSLLKCIEQRIKEMS